MSSDGKREKSESSVRAVDRVADVLGCFVGHDAQSFSDICTKAGLSKSTAHRFLATLERRGLLSRDPWSQHYRVGPTILRLASSIGAHLQQVAAPIMRELRDRCGETTVLTIRVADHRVAVLQFESRQQLRRRVEIGTPFPLHLGGAGKSILAFAPAADRERVLANMSREPITPYTPTDPVLLADELERIRRRGYAVSENEYIMGVISIGAPIRDHFGRVIAALGITGPSIRFSSEALARHIQDLTKAAREVSHALGADDTPEATGLDMPDVA